MSQDIFRINPEKDDFPTYVSIRPDWSDDRWIRRGGGKVMTFERDTTKTYVRRDSMPREGSEFSRPIVTSVEEYDTPKRTIKIGYRTQRETLKGSGRFVGRPSTKHTISNELFERLQLYDMFGENTFDFEVQIGIVDPDAKHVGFNGIAVPYSGMFRQLSGFGYSPLAPLLNENIIREVRRSLASTILSSIRHRGPKDSIARKVEVWARNVRDMVRDYIRGQNTIESKPALEDSTIYMRNSRVKYRSDLYKYGTANALWESGTLESDITFKVVPLRKITLSPYERKILKDIEDRAKKRREDKKKIERKIGRSAIKKDEKQKTARKKHASTVDDDASFKRARAIIDFDEARKNLNRLVVKHGLFARIGRKDYHAAYDLIERSADFNRKQNKPMSDMLTELDEAHTRAKMIAHTWGFEL